jgi:heat shock protein HslJ
MPAVRPVLRTLAAAALILAAAGCADPGPSPSPSSVGPAALAGTSWIVKAVNGRAPVAGAVPTVAFDADAVTGSGGCNHIGGRYRYDRATGAFAVRELGGTAMGCLQPGVTEFETAFLQVLGNAGQAGIGPDGELILDGPAGRVLLVPLIHP